MSWDAQLVAAPCAFVLAAFPAAAQLGNGYSFAIVGNQNTGEGTCTARIVWLRPRRG